MLIVTLTDKVCKMGKKVEGSGGFFIHKLRRPTGASLPSSGLRVFSHSSSKNDFSTSFASPVNWATRAV
jgi:hypothetical protein